MHLFVVTFGGKLVNNTVYDIQMISPCCGICIETQVAELENTDSDSQEVLASCSVFFVS